MLNKGSVFFQCIQKDLEEYCAQGYSQKSVIISQVKLLVTHFGLIDCPVYDASNFSKNSHFKR